MQKSEAMAFKKKNAGDPPIGAAPKAGAKSGQNQHRQPMIPPPQPVNTSNSFGTLAVPEGPAAKKRKRSRPKSKKAAASKAANPAPVGIQDTSVGSAATASVTGASAEDQQAHTVDPRTLASNTARAEVDACKEEESVLLAYIASSAELNTDFARARCAGFESELAVCRSKMQAASHRITDAKQPKEKVAALQLAVDRATKRVTRSESEEAALKDAAAQAYQAAVDAEGETAEARKE